jgi:WD40 repeat protein
MSQFPYPGLRSFLKEEEDIFFGREEQVDQLLERLEKSHFLAVVGPSGCGKSSLVKAGMLPALELGFLESVGEKWQIAEMRPGTQPMRNLAESLLENWDGPVDAERVAFLVANLERGPLGLLEKLREKPLPDDTGLLILVDQFEEIFRYHRQDIDDAERFVDLLLASAEQKQFPIYVVITMRSEFLGDCALFPGLPEMMNDNQFLTPRMNRDQRRGAIIGPAEMFDGKIEPALVNWILNEMGSDPDQLPLMQHALMRLWTIRADHILRLDDYLNDNKLGTLKNSLSNHADEIYNKLHEDQKQIAETLFRCLTQRSEKNIDTRRPSKISEVAEIAEVLPEKVEKVVNDFSASGCNFLTTDGSFVDISHESLIRQWNTLKDWVEKEAESADHYRHIESSALRWKKKEGALWGTPDLEYALKWKKEQNPNPYWAKRYGDHFHLAMEFLDESEKKRAEEKREERRKRLLKGFSIAASFIIVIIFYFSLWALHERGIAQDNLAKNYFYLTSQKFRTDDYTQARQLINESRNLDEKTAAEYVPPRNLMSWFADLMGGTPEHTCNGAGAILQSIALSPDGRTLAVAGEKGTIALFDAEIGNMLRQWTGHDQHDINGIVFYPDGKRIATAGDNRRIILWNLPDGENQPQWMTDKPWAFAISPDGSLLASSGPDGNITIRDSETGREQQKLEGHSAPVNDLAFSPDGTCIASASSDKTVKIWKLDSGELLYKLGHNSEVLAVAFHPSGELLATGTKDNEIRLWNIESGEMTDILEGHKNAVSDLTFSDSGDYLISASTDQTIRIWDTDSGVTLRVLQGHTAGVRGVIARGETVYSVGNDQTLRAWGMASQNMSIARISGEPSTCAISPDCNKIAAGFADGSVELFALPEIKELWKKDNAHEKDVNQVVFSPDGKFLASAGFDDAVKVWQINDRALYQSFKGHESGAHGIAYSPDGKTLITAGRDGQIGKFEIGREQGEFHPAHEGAVTAVAFDSAGQRLVSTGENGQTKLWDIKTWPPILLQRFPASGDALMRAAFSPDNSRIAAVGRDTRVRIFDVRYPASEQTFIGHKNTVYDVAFTPGGQVATVSMDATIRFWDTEIGSELFTLNLPAKSGQPVPLWDFDLQCTASENCIISVPLTSGKLVVYRLQNIFF